MALQGTLVEAPAHDLTRAVQGRRQGELLRTSQPLRASSKPRQLSPETTATGSLPIRNDEEEEAYSSGIQRRAPLFVELSYIALTS